MSKRNSNISYFSFARSAFKYGLNSLEHDGRDGILVPEYICDVVFHPIQQAGFNVITYPITDTFEPDLDAIKGLLITEKIHALLLVHYFGQPQNLDLYSK